MTRITPNPKWPKQPPPRSPEERARADAFMKLWHEELARRKRYGLIEHFNHQFPIWHSPVNFRTTLEIGAGLGEHLEYEKLSAEQQANYYCNDFRENMAAEIRRRFPQVQTVVADCQQPLPFADGFFDRIIAIHVLEHLPNLPACLRELHRLINKEHGRLLIVIPTEGSLAYSLARKVSAQRMWNRHFDVPYDEFYKREHINVPAEIIAELEPYFILQSRIYFPLPFLPFPATSLVIGLSLRPRSLSPS